jgi:hypothetical protein
MLKSVDVFPKAVKSELVVHTNAGGLLSLISFAAVCYYIGSEVLNWSIARTRTQMVLNNGRLPPMLPIYLDILVANNCSDLHFEYTNVKRTLELDGDIVKTFVQENEFCHITANLRVHTVPASFHIGLGESFIGPAGDHQHLWYTLHDRNVSHYINRLSFGEFRIISPVDNSNYTIVKAVPYQVTYALQLITVHVGETIGYQATASLIRTNLEKIRSVGITGIVFEWSFSPIGLDCSFSREPVISLVSRILAVLGCLLVFVNMLDSLVFKLQQCGV